MQPLVFGLSSQKYDRRLIAKTGLPSLTDWLAEIALMHLKEVQGF